jgi:hypothetical protein
MFGEDIANKQIDFDSVEKFKKVYNDNCQHNVSMDGYVRPGVTLDDKKIYGIPSDEKLFKLKIAYNGIRNICWILYRSILDGNQFLKMIKTLI